MEATEKNKHQHHPYSSPLPNPPPSSLLKDISNFKTPKQNLSFLSPNPQQFFTSSKQTPKSSSLSTLRRHRPSLAPSQSKAARRLKAFELEQYKSARKAQIAKEKSLKSLATSLTVWLNFLFENPRSCGFDISKLTGQQDRCDEPVVSKNGKRDIRRGGEVGHDRLWRGSKRQRDLSWCHVADTETTLFPNWMFLDLRSSLSDVCSFDDLKERMRVYLSLGSCKEIFEVMTHVTKNIDEGRLKMKVNCSIVTDVGMKKKAMRILMCYDPIWLRIGLYIIFGGDSLLPNGDVTSEQEISFLKMVIEKQFFSHTGLAEVYAYNKLVAGLYRPGYFEKLGNVILKRVLLLVLILDRAKSQSSIPINYGIDGSDGGSPLLFTLQSNVKSSHQMIHDFLSSDVMHGEGNLLAHLVIIGYKVFYEQSPLIEYDFRVTNLFEDLQDGVRLCRAIMLLQHDSSILTKLVVPSDTRKKNLVNCGIALQHLKHAGVPLYDEDGTVIVGEDIVDGDKELTLSLLWNIFVHLQLPLLVSKVLLSEEILKIRGVGVDHSNTCTPLDMLLHWIQAICESYDCKVDNFASMIDGRAMWCLLDYYFRKDNRSSYSYKDPNGKIGEMSIMSATNYTDAVHNFLLSQKLTTLLGKFPEVIQVSDLLEHNGACNDQSVIILLVFLSFQLIVKKNMDQLNYHKFLGYNRHSPERKQYSKGGFVHSEAVENQVENGNSDMTRDFKAIMAWWREMAQRNKKCDLNPVPPALECFSTGKLSTNTPSEKALIACDENEVNCLQKKAASRIQLGWRSFILCKSVRCQHSAATKIQTYYRSWLLRKAFVNQKHAVIKIQSMFKCIKCWRDFQQYKIATRSATIIQAYVRGLIARREACRYRCMILTIQSHWRGWLTRKELSHSHRIVAAIEIQSIIRGSIARKRLLGASSLREAATVGYVSKTQRGCFHSLELKIVLCSVLKLQKWWRDILFLKARMKSVLVIQAHVRAWIVRQGATKKRRCIVLIQSRWRGWLTRKELCHSHRISAAIEIQSFVRGWITRKRLLASSFREALTILCSVLKLQTWWRNILLLKARIKSVIVIQAHVRGWIVRQQATNKKQCIVVIQSHWRGWLTRKELSHSHRIVAAIEIQSIIRGSIARKRLLGASSLCEAATVGYVSKTQRGCFHSLELKIVLCSVLKLQTWWRDILFLKARMKSVLVIQAHVRAWIVRQGATKKRRHIVLIQSHWRGWLTRKELCHSHKISAAIEIQSFVRGWITRKRLLGASSFREAPTIGYVIKDNRDCFQILEVKIVLCSVLKLQTWWRNILLLKARIKSVIVIQAHVRGWVVRRQATNKRQCIVVIQSHWRGYGARKNSRGQLLDLRLRVQKSAANVDDNMRILNRLIAALSELLTMKSVSGILHTCETLDTATRYSQKCCEELVAAGAIDTILKLIRSVTRSIPDQEVLRHSLSTLRNLARYPHLTEVLIDSRGSVQTILWEFLRNKEEGYFIASELLEKICLNQRGIETLHQLPVLLKRLKSLVNDLQRRAGNEKRNSRSLVGREHTERRLRVAMELLKLITSG